MNYCKNQYKFESGSKSEERDILKSKIRSRIRRLFDILDKDRSNELDKDELTLLLEKLDPEVITHPEKMAI